MNAVWGLISIFIQFIYVRKCIKVRFVRTPREHYSEMFSFSAWSTVSAIASRLVFNITPTVIGITATTATVDIAIFGIIATIEGYFFTITTAINGMFLTRITKIVQDDDGTKLTELAVKLGRIQFALNSLLILGFFVIGKDFIVMWMGAGYTNAYYGILLVIIPGLFYNALQVPVTTLTVMNLVKYDSWIQVATGVCNVILSFLFSHYYGAVGAALSICLAYLLRTLLTLIVIRRKTNVDVAVFARECYVKMLRPLLLSLLVCLFLGQFIKVTSWICLCIKGGLIVLVYMTVLLLVGLNRDECNLIMRKLFKKA